MSNTNFVHKDDEIVNNAKKANQPVDKNGVAYKQNVNTKV